MSDERVDKIISGAIWWSYKELQVNDYLLVRDRFRINLLILYY